MYKNALENLIITKKVPKSILLFGLCDYQINEYSKRILNTYKDENDEPLFLYFDDYDFSIAKYHLTQPSLFGGKNILVIKTDKNISTKELDFLIDKCYKNKDSFMIVELYVDGNIAKSMQTSFKKNKNADFVRFFPANYNDAIKFMREKANELGLNISNYVLSKLFALQNENLALSISEFNKFSIYNKEITENELERLVYGLGSISIDSFVSKIINLQDIRKDFKLLSEDKNYDEVYILTLIQVKITQLFLLHSYIKIHGSLNIKEVLGFLPPPNVAQELQRLSIKISMSKFNKVLKHLINNELRLKIDSNLDKQSFLLSTILQTQDILRD